MNQLTPVFWEGTFVGSIKNLDMEMFYIFGEWQPAQQEHPIEYERFLAHVVSPDATLVRLGVDENCTYATAELIADGEIELKMAFTE